MAKVADIINAYESSGWHCRLHGCLRTDSSNDALATLAVANGDCHINSGALGLLLDTDTAKYHGIRITRDKDGKNDNRGCVHLISSVVLTPTGTGALQTTIYEIDGTTETAIYTPAAEVSTTENTYDDDDWGDKPIRCTPGNELLVHLTAATTLTACNMRVAYTSIGAHPRMKYRSARQ
jgi:hypothetical protein